MFIYLFMFFHGFLIDAVHQLEFIAASGMMMNKEFEMMWKYGVIACFQGLSLQWFWRTEKNKRNFSQGGQCLGQDLYSGSFKYKSELLLSVPPCLVIFVSYLKFL